MINGFTTLLGEYVPLAGDGIASLNLMWIVAAIFTLMSIWFFYKIILKFMDWVIGH